MITRQRHENIVASVKLKRKGFNFPSSIHELVADTERSPLLCSFSLRERTYDTWTTSLEGNICYSYYAYRGTTSFSIYLRPILNSLWLANHLTESKTSSLGKGGIVNEEDGTTIVGFSPLQSLHSMNRRTLFLKLRKGYDQTCSHSEN